MVIFGYELSPFCGRARQMLEDEGVHESQIKIVSLGAAPSLPGLIAEPAMVAELANMYGAGLPCCFVDGENVGDFKLLAAALRTNTSLLALDLSESGLGAEGCTMLASALKLNSTLTMLDLARNNIGEEGATAIADVLMSANSAITNLYVGGNDLSDSARQCLEDAWKSRDRKECGLRL